MYLHTTQDKFHPIHEVDLYNTPLQLQPTQTEKLLERGKSYTSSDRIASSYSSMVLGAVGKIHHEWQLNPHLWGRRGIFQTHTPYIPCSISNDRMWTLHIGRASTLQASPLSEPMSGASGGSDRSAIRRMLQSKPVVQYPNRRSKLTYKASNHAAITRCVLATCSIPSSYPHQSFAPMMAEDWHFRPRNCRFRGNI